MNKIFSLFISLLITLISAAQAPANDDCSNAVLLTPSTNSVCAATTAGDARYKQNIITLPNALHNLLQLRDTEYYFNNALPGMNSSWKKQTGLTAQEGERVFPELVITNREGYKSVNYLGLIPMMIESIKEQQ